MTFSHPYKDENGSTVKDGYYFRKLMFPDKWHLGFVIEDIIIAYALKRGDFITIEEKIEELNFFLLSRNKDTMKMLRNISNEVNMDSTANDIAKVLLRELNKHLDSLKNNSSNKYQNFFCLLYTSDAADE